MQSEIKPATEEYEPLIQQESFESIGSYTEGATNGDTPNPIRCCLFQASKSSKARVLRIRIRVIVALIGFAITALSSIPIGFSIMSPYSVPLTIGLVCIIYRLSHLNSPELFF